MGTLKHLINVAFLGVLCASLGLVCGTNVLAPRVAALEAIADEQIVVVDANGTLLGPLVRPDYAGTPSIGSGIVLLRAEGSPPLPLYVERNVLYGTASVVHFQSADCSGGPFIERFSLNGDPIFVQVAFLENAAMVFYSEPDALPQEVTLNSYLYAAGCVTATYTIPGMVPAFGASLQPFTPPYSVVTRGELAAQ